VTITWPDLDRDRWTWAVSARAELRARLTGLADPDNVSSMAHVMLVGDTHSGKTTVLLWLLGVSDGAVEQTAEVLRAGRESGRSATATPVRYCWSGDPDKWLLKQGKEQKDRISRWVTADELMERLADYRSPSGEQIRWNVDDPPLEIGIPDGMAGSAPRPALRILDMPGLYAASGQEDRVARELVSRYAPSMSVIVIVQAAHRMADAMQDVAITGNPHLACWHSDPARFRIVLTKAFSAASSHSQLEAEFGSTRWDPRAVTAWLRAHVTAQLTQSAEVTAGQDGLEKIVFPVDVGETRKNMARGDPGYAAHVLPANDLLLAKLCGTLEDRASEDGLYLSAPNLERHILSLVRQKEDRRQQRRDRLAGERAAAQEQVTEAESTLRRLLDRRDQVARETTGIRADAATLAASNPPVHRPAKPEMKGLAVRESQEDDRSALVRAAGDLWDAWRAPAVSHRFPAVLPPDFERRLHARYDDIVGCCGECSNFPPARWTRGRPDHCYAKMTAAIEDVRSWIIDELMAHIEPAVSQAHRRLREAGTRCDRAERLLTTCRQALFAAVAACDQAQREAEQEEQDDKKECAIAKQVLAVHSRHNERYVRELARRTQTATPDERGFLAIAAPRAVHDLDRMHGRA
jgi:hypothetical protein